MNIIELAANKGITITHNNGSWTATFGTEQLITTTMTSTLERFLSECELVETREFLCLRISGWIECKRQKDVQNVH